MPSQGQKYGQAFVAEVRSFLCENRLPHLLKGKTFGVIALTAPHLPDSLTYPLSAYTELVPLRFRRHLPVCSALFAEDTRGTLPPRTSSACLPAAEEGTDEEFMSVGGTTDGPQGLQAAIGTRCGACDSVEPNATQACASQSVYFRSAPSLVPPEDHAPNIHSSVSGSTLGDSECRPPLHQQQPRNWQQESANLLPPPQHGVVGQSTKGASELWDPEDLDCLDYL